MSALDTNTEKQAVVFALDEGYVAPTLVALDSALRRLTQDAEVVLLVDESLSNASLTSLASVIQSYGREMRLIKTDPAVFAEAKPASDFITTPSYYRLALPSLLQDIGRCLYLDGDIAVSGDLDELLSLDLEGSPIAGVYAPTYHFFPWRSRLRMAVQSLFSPQLRLGVLRSYINSGVLLMDLNILREIGAEEQFLTWMRKGLDDQDCINQVLGSSIKPIDPKFNLMTSFCGELPARGVDSDDLDSLYGPGVFDSAKNAPVVIHYATPAKPWNTEGLPLSNYWEFARHDASISLGFDPFEEKGKVIDDGQRKYSHEN